MPSVFLAFYDAAGSRILTELKQTTNDTFYYLPENVTDEIKLPSTPPDRESSIQLELNDPFVLLSVFGSEKCYLLQDSQMILIPQSTVSQQKSLLLRDGDHFMSYAGRWSLHWDDDAGTFSNSMRPPVLPHQRIDEPIDSEMIEPVEEDKEISDVPDTDELKLDNKDDKFVVEVDETLTSTPAEDSSTNNFASVAEAECTSPDTSSPPSVEVAVCQNHEPDLLNANMEMTNSESVRATTPLSPPPPMHTLNNDKDAYTESSATSDDLEQPKTDQEVIAEENQNIPVIDSMSLPVSEADTGSTTESGSEPESPAKQHLCITLPLPRKRKADTIESRQQSSKRDSKRKRTAKSTSQTKPKSGSKNSINQKSKKGKTATRVQSDGSPEPTGTIIVASPDSNSGPSSCAGTSRSRRSATSTSPAGSAKSSTKAKPQYDGPSPVIFFGSSTSIEEKSRTMATFYGLGGRKARSINTANMLCVAGDALKKTSNLLIAIVSGKDVVTEQWIIDTHRRGGFPDPASYVPRDREKEVEWNFELADAIQRGKNGLGDLLTGRTVFFTPQLKQDLGNRARELGNLATVLGADAVKDRIPKAKDMDQYTENEILVVGVPGDPYAAEVRRVGSSVYTKDLLSMAALRGVLELDTSEFLVDVPIKNENSQ